MELLAVRGIYIQQREENSQPRGVTAGLDVQDTGDRDISKEAVDKKRKPYIILRGRQSEL